MSEARFDAPKNNEGAMIMFLDRAVATMAGLNERASAAGLIEKDERDKKKKSTFAISGLARTLNGVPLPGHLNVGRLREFASHDETVLRASQEILGHYDEMLNWVARYTQRSRETSALSREMAIQNGDEERLLDDPGILLAIVGTIKEGTADKAGLREKLQLGIKSRLGTAVSTAILLTPMLLNELGLNDGEKKVNSQQRALVSFLLVAALMRKDRLESAYGLKKRDVLTRDVAYLKLSESKAGSKDREILQRRIIRGAVILGVIACVAGVAILTALGWGDLVKEAKQNTPPTPTAAPLATAAPEQLTDLNYESYRQGANLNFIKGINAPRVIELTTKYGAGWAFVPERQKDLEALTGVSFTPEQINAIKDNPQLLIDLLQNMETKEGISPEYKDDIQKAIDFYKLRMTNEDEFIKKYSPKTPYLRRQDQEQMVALGLELLQNENGPVNFANTTLSRPETPNLTPTPRPTQTPGAYFPGLEGLAISKPISKAILFSIFAEHPSILKIFANTSPVSDTLTLAEIKNTSRQIKGRMTRREFLRLAAQAIAASVADRVGV